MLLDCIHTHDELTGNLTVSDTIQHQMQHFAFPCCDEFHERICIEGRRMAAYRFRLFYQSQQPGNIVWGYSMSLGLTKQGYHWLPFIQEEANVPLRFS